MYICKLSEDNQTHQFKKRMVNIDVSETRGEGDKDTKEW